MGVIIQDNSLVQNRLLDPFASYDSLLTSQLLSGVYKEGNAVINGLKPTITSDKVITIEPGSFLVGYTLIHITQPIITLDITPLSVPDGFYLVVGEYTYQLVQPAPDAIIKLITPDFYIPNLQVILKIIIVQGGNFYQAFDSAYDAGTLTTYKRKVAKFRLDSDDLNKNNSNYPRKPITISTNSGQGRLILVDRSNINDYYELTAQLDPLVLSPPYLSINLNLLDRNDVNDDFREGDIFLHDSDAGTIAHDIHDGIYPKRLYVDNGALLTESQGKLKSDDLQFIGQFDTVGFTNGGPVYNLYAGSQVLVDRHFLQSASFVALDSIIMIRASDNTIIKITINLFTGQPVFTQIPDPIVYVQGYAFYIDQNGIFLQVYDDIIVPPSSTATDKLIKIDGINPATFNYTAISQKDLCGFLAISKLFIKSTANSIYYQLYFDSVSETVKAKGGLLTGLVPNQIFLNGNDNDLNWNNPLATLTVVNDNRLFAMDGKHTLEMRDALTNDAVKFAPNISKTAVIQVEGVDGVGGTQAYVIENTSLMIQDTNVPTDRYRYSWNFVTDVLEIAREHFLKTATDILLTPAKNWIFRVKRRLFHQISDVGLNTIYTVVNPKTVLGNTIPYLIHAEVQVVTFSLAFAQWMTPVGLIFRRVSDDQRFRVSFDGTPIAIPQIVPGSPGVFDIDIAEDRDLTFWDNVTRKYFSFDENAGNIELEVSDYGVFGDNIFKNYVEYNNSGSSIKWGIVAAAIKTIDYTIPETITFPPSTIYITDPFVHNPGFGKLGFAGDCVGQKFVIDIVPIGLTPELTRSSTGVTLLTTVLNFGINDIASAVPTGWLILRDTETGDYYQVCAVLGAIDFVLITPITVIPAQSVVVQGRTTYWNSSGATVDDWRWEYYLKNGALQIKVFDVYQDYSLLAYPHIDDVTNPSIKDTPATLPYINYNVIGSGHSELKYNHVTDSLYIEAYVAVGGPNAENFPAYIIEDSITGIGYFIYGRDTDDAIHVEELTTVPIAPRHVLIYRGGIILPTQTASTGVYVLTLENGSLEVEHYANVGLVPPPTWSRFEVLRPFNLPLSPNPIKINLSVQTFLPNITPTLENNVLAFTTEIVGTLAKITIGVDLLSYSVSTILVGSYPTSGILSDCYNTDGIIFKDIHDGRFYKITYNTVSGKFIYDQVTYAIGSPKIFYTGVMQKETVSNDYAWVQLNDNKLSVTPGNSY